MRWKKYLGRISAVLVMVFSVLRLAGIDWIVLPLAFAMGTILLLAALEYLPIAAKIIRDRAAERGEDQSR